MSYATRLNAEINTLLDALADEGREWRATWIAHEICNQHAGALTDNEDANFWRHCGYSDCRREVTRCINRRAGDRADRDEGGQYTLPGYKHLQSYYVVERDGEEVGVSVHELTDGEIVEKQRTYRAMGAACFAHADELDRFQRTRPEVA